MICKELSYLSLMLISPQPYELVFMDGKNQAVSYVQGPRANWHHVHSCLQALSGLLKPQVFPLLLETEKQAIA